jgi:hypothetical protein
MDGSNNNGINHHCNKCNERVKEQFINCNCMFIRQRKRILYMQNTKE